MRNNLTSLFIGTFLLAAIAGYGQNISNNKNADSFLIFDQIVGIENTAIFNGFEYIEKHRIINNKHKFFKAYNFIKGTVIYDGQPFYEVSLKYNVFEDLVLVQLENKQGKNTIQLFDELLDGFSIDDHQFVNIKNKNSTVSGIHELIFENSHFKVFKKYTLKEKTLLDKKLLYHEFEADDAEYFFKYNEGIQEVTLKNLIETFPNDKDLVKSRYRFNKKKLNSNSDIFMQQLFTEISNNGVTE